MLPENKIINSLWIGDELSNLELLTIKSFLAKGHRFRLWLYDIVKTPLPVGVEICKAEQIIPKEKVFSYKYANEYGHGKGSYAGFSDIFRYKLLYEYGGWWVDMDVTCLKPFDFETPYFFRNHHDLKVVGNVMKCPQGSELMMRCFTQATASVNEENTDWHKPINILNTNISDLVLENYIHQDISNPDRWEITSRYIWETDILPNHWYFIHWQNEEWRFKHVSKKEFYYPSAIGLLTRGYHLTKASLTLYEKVKNQLKFSKIFRTLFQ